MKIGLVVVLVAVLFVVGGCGRGDGTSPVHGVVSYQGKVLTRGLVNFHGGTHPLGGSIDADGNYEIDAPPGEYTVTVTAPALPPEGWREGQPLPEMKPLVPERFSMPRTSGLTVTVGAEMKQLDLDLE